MKLLELMVGGPVLSVEQDDDIATAVDRMVWSGVRHLPVMEQGRVVGVLSESDLLKRRAMARGGGGDVPDTVRDFMSAPPEVADPDMDAAEAASRMAERKIGCLPIIKAGQLIGIVTTSDFLRVEAGAARETGRRRWPAERADKGQDPKVPTAAGVHGDEVPGPMIPKSGTAGSETSVRGDPPREEPIRGAAGEVSAVMTTEVSTVMADDHLTDAVVRMSQMRVRHLPVLDGDRRVIGMLSDRDIRTVIGAPTAMPLDDTGLSVRLRSMKVADIMTRSPIVVRPNTSLNEVARHFIQDRIGAVPVVDNDGRLLGIVSYVDLLQAAFSASNA